MISRFGKRAGRDSLLGLKRQPVEEAIPQVIGILVVLKDLLDMDRALLSRCKRVREGFRVQLLADPHSGNRVIPCWPWIILRKRVEQLPLRGSDFEGLPRLLLFTVVRSGPRTTSRASVLPTWAKRTSPGNGRVTVIGDDVKFAHVGKR